MTIYRRKIFTDEDKAKRFSYRHRGRITYTQAMNENGKISFVYLVEYI